MQADHPDHPPPARPSPPPTRVPLYPAAPVTPTSLFSDHGVETSAPFVYISHQFKALGEAQRFLGANPAIVRTAGFKGASTAGGAAGPFHPGNDFSGINVSFLSPG